MSLVRARGRRWTVACVVSALLAVMAGACSGSGGTADPTPTTNTPPTIQSLVVGAPVVEVTGDQSVQLTATVTDAETSAAQLEYQWSVSALPATGTFVGTGAQVRWKASSTTPDVPITLTVVETYVSGATTKTNVVSKTLQVRYNDLIIGGLVSQFLTDFGTISVSAVQCVRNFSDSCSGKAAELSDITGQRNRSDAQIESATVATPSIVLNAAMTSASASTACSFRDRLTNGTHRTVGGTCDLTAVYESSRWYLCTSNFNAPFTITTDSFGPPVVTMSRRLLPLFSHP